MSERLLLIRSAASDKYVVLGTDFPCARVFDTATGSLVSTLKPAKFGQMALTSDTLTCVAVGTDAQPARRKQDASPTLEQSYAAAGLSSGYVLLHHVEADEALGEMLVSPTQQSVASIAISGGFVWCLTGDGKVAVISLKHVEDGVCFQFSCQPSASCVTVTGRMHNTEMVFNVLVSGSSSAVYQVTVPRHDSGNGAADHGTFQVERQVSFASHGSPVTFSWLSPLPESSLSSHSAPPPNGRPAVTASAQDGVVRIWDVQPANVPGLTLESSAAVQARCRRTLLCGQRIADLSVLQGKTHCFVSVTTCTGAILVWDLGAALLPSTPESLPFSPDLVLHSTVVVGRLLMCRLLPFTSEETLADLSVLVMRGRFALPFFERLCVGRLAPRASNAPRTQPQRHTQAVLATLAIAGSSRVAVRGVPLSASHAESLKLQESLLQRAAGGRGAEGNAFDAVDSVWVKHHVAAVATKASVTPTESFRPARHYRAGSTAELPTKKMTLEQRLREVEKGVSAPEESAPQVLGLATTPLYQALHANDVAAVMELLSVASRSAEGMRDTVQSLHLPYCLQLLSVISERLGICTRSTAAGAQNAAGSVVGSGLEAVSSRSPLLQWIDAILRYRGMELYDAQVAYEKQVAAGEDVACTSPPKDFIAPILHQYRRMTRLSDSLATLHGRLGVFLGVRPSEKNRFVNRSRKMLSSNLDIGQDPVGSGMLHNDMYFPVMFAEVGSRRRGNYTVRVHHKPSVAKQKKSSRDTDLLKEAKQLAKEAAKQNSKSFLDNEDEDVWDDVIMDKIAEDGDLPLEDLEAMELNSSDSDLVGSSDDAEGSTGRRGGAAKRVRHETEEMFADDGSDSQEASSASDGDGALDSSRSESAEEESSTSSEEESESESAPMPEEDEESASDGMGEDMKELLEQSGLKAKQMSRDKKAEVD